VTIEPVDRGKEDAMHFDDDEFVEEAPERGSDELLSSDHLRLPENANPLVRLHAIRSWLTRRIAETKQEIGEAALNLQQIMADEQGTTRLRRRELQTQQERIAHTQEALQAAQQRLTAYEEAGELLEECVSHTTVSERLLVEYYLTLENLIQDHLQETDAPAASVAPSPPRVAILADILQRVERVGSTVEEE
jgi:hypothetical protein